MLFVYTAVCLLFLWAVPTFLQFA